MSLVTFNNVSSSFGAESILDHANLIIESGERIGLIGRNGAGKSTLLKLLDGELSPDAGELHKQQGLVTGRLIQEVPNNLTSDVQSIIALGIVKQGDTQLGETLVQYYHSAGADLNAQAILNEHDGWTLDRAVKTLCSKFDLDPTSHFAELSGGLKRRVLMARALVNSPDIILLDEPTNHLDIDTIIWLENLLLSLQVTLIIVSHDRSFIDRLCTKIIELDRGRLTSYPGRYQDYLQLKSKALAEEDRHNAKFDKKLAQEEVWIRQGIQARRTRNEGRVRALKAMRVERQQRRQRQNTANIKLNTASQSGKVVIRAKHLHAEFGGQTLIKDFSCRILRGDKVGIIGPNGCGKSTLIKLLTGELNAQPHPNLDTQIHIGTNLQIAYLDQHRSAIRDDWSVQDNVSGNTEITINGQTKHIMGYLQDFLFSPSRARAPAAKLSGGERNRLLLAKLFTQPFNLLILDEPTNDLDYETLELLEQLLMDYQGTLLLVSHDRTFLNNVVTSTIAFEGNGDVYEYIGGYDDWLQQKRQTPLETSPAASLTTTVSTAKANKNTTKKPSKLSYQLQRELDQLPNKIDHLEKQIAQVTHDMSQAEFYQQDSTTVATAHQHLKQLQQELDHCITRWEELESASDGLT